LTTVGPSASTNDTVAPSTSIHVIDSDSELEVSLEGGGGRRSSGLSSSFVVSEFEDDICLLAATYTYIYPSCSLFENILKSSSSPELPELTKNLFQIHS